MFTDPQTITINAVPFVCARVSTEGRKSTYQTNDLLMSLTLSHILAKDRVRSMARFDWKKIVADPLTAVNDYETLSLYQVIDRPLAGFSVVEVQQFIAGFETWDDAAAQAKRYGQES